MGAAAGPEFPLFADDMAALRRLQPDAPQQHVAVQVNHSFRQKQLAQGDAVGSGVSGGAASPGAACRCTLAGQQIIAVHCIRRLEVRKRLHGISSLLNDGEQNVDK